MQILTIPEHDINIALGTDYTGECKKGFLRQGMFRADRRGMLGLHAGTKVVRARDDATRQAQDATACSCSASPPPASPPGRCHQLGLDAEQGEGTWVAQDDIVFLQARRLRPRHRARVLRQDRRGREAAGGDVQRARRTRSALLENVMVDAKGRDRLPRRAPGRERPRRARPPRAQGAAAAASWSRSAPTRSTLPPLEELDGIVFAFITRRDTIMPFAQRLTPEQGVMAYLWGESTHSFATVPAKAGEIGAHRRHGRLHHRGPGAQGERVLRHRDGPRGPLPGQGALLPVQHRRDGRDHRGGQGDRQEEARAQGRPACRST